VTSLFDVKAIPFGLFSLFKGVNREIHARVLFMIYEMSSERVDRVVPVNELVDAMRKECVMNDYEASDVPSDGIDNAEVSDLSHKRSRERMEINTLRRVRLICCNVQYDSVARDNVSVVSLSRFGNKLIRFILDICQDSSDDVRLANVQSAASVMRLLQSRDNHIDHPYVSLESAYNNINDFITRLNEFSSDFYDFIDIHPADTSSVVAAGEWLNTVLGSRYVRDFYELNNSSLGYVARVNEIGYKASLIENDPDLIDWIVMDKIDSESAVRMTLGDSYVCTSYDELRDRVVFMLKRLEIVSRHEFGSLMRYLDGIVFNVIQRAKQVVMSYIGNEDVSNYTTKLSQLIRMYESTGDNIPDRLFDIYRYRIFDEHSLVRQPAVAEVISYDPNAYGSSSVSDSNALPFFDYHSAGKNYVNRNIPVGKVVDSEDLKIDSHDDFMDFFSMMVMGLTRNGESLVDVSDSMKTVNQGVYTYPKALITRKDSGGNDNDK
jgi:hypothetical protein